MQLHQALFNLFPLRQKLFPVRERRYINSGEVRSLMHMFDVPKGEEDVRIVYNGTASGINDCLWAPHFGLAMISHVNRALMPSYSQADLDIGEMFLNFMLGEEIRPYSGVDISHIKTRKSDLPEYLPEPLEAMPEWEKDRSKRWERWERNWMGLTVSPYRSAQMMMVAKEVAEGNRKDPHNPFQWEVIVLNLPGMKNRDPRKPWVYKQRVDESIASEVFVYVDDSRITACSPEEAWKTVCRFSSVMSNLGIQDAARKRTSPSDTPGPWAGSVVHTKGGLYQLVSQKKWDKTKSLLGELREMIESSSDGMVDRKRLEQIRGFLIYVSRTYPWMPPYLKGLHLTIDGWRPGRDAEGFKVKAGVRRVRPFIFWEWEEEQ